MPDIRLDKNSQMFSYEFPQKRIAFVAPSSIQRNKPVPAYRDFGIHFIGIRR